MATNKSSLALFAAASGALFFSMVCLTPDTWAIPKDGKVVEPAPFKPVQSSDESKRGRAVFEKHRCTTCHTTGKSGGCLAPPLDGIGARRSESFILARITNDPSEEEKFSQMYGQSELMPHLRISAPEAKLVAKYLLTLPEPKRGFLVIGHAEKKKGVEHPSDAATFRQGKESAEQLARSVKHGRELLSSKGCLACHSIGNIGGKFALKFDGISSRLPRRDIEKQMRNAELLSLQDDTEYGARGTVMPPLDLSEKDVQDLTNFLMTIK